MAAPQKKCHWSHFSLKNEKDLIREKKERNGRKRGLEAGEGLVWGW